ncbi:AmmeMemoRadiSam system radical SAM enzyme [Candidatus Woesearchaeota archaeon]|nr:AmmeMemoRadiSam system radical SAM enzyme [Candidatus Woesearchaeota archaeon]
MKKAAYTKEDQCFLCPKHCVIREGRRGFCKTRKNIHGVIYAVNWGKPIGINVDPIEKKPLYHFFPGQKILSFGTLGCNLDCEGCQNHDIARGIPSDSQEDLVLPKEIISIAKKEGCDMIAYTYTEPIIFFEYLVDIARLAREEGIKNVVVTNGYIEQEPLKEMLRVVDAFNVDLKFFSEKKYESYAKASLAPVLETLKTISKSNSHLEITNLVIPGLSDDLGEAEKMYAWISQNLSVDVPVHISAFSPHHKLISTPSTNVEVLEEIKKIAEKHLRFVYLGNVNVGGDTLCPNCKETIIKRDWYNTTVTEGFNGVCPSCEEKIVGEW